MTHTCMCNDPLQLSHVTRMNQFWIGCYCCRARTLHMNGSCPLTIMPTSKKEKRQVPYLNESYLKTFGVGKGGGGAVKTIVRVTNMNGSCHTYEE